MIPPDSDPTDFFALSPEQLEATDFDRSLVDAVIAHWHATMMSSPSREAVWASLGVTDDLAVSLRLGLSDRSLGLRIPKRDWKAGRMMRERLEEWGIVRSSGHEAFRGCVVVPVVRHHRLIAIYGHPLDSRLSEVWANGLPGGVLDVAPEIPTSRAIVTTSIPDALCVLGALGDDAGEHVIAPARVRGFSAQDLRELKERFATVVVLGRDTSSVAKRLQSLGLKVTTAAEELDLRDAVARASSPHQALAALLDAAQPLEVAAATSDVAPPDPVTTHTPGRDEAFVQFVKRSWRVRGARARGNAEGDRLQVALSVNDLATGHFHLDSLDLYAARQRGSFLDAAHTELSAPRERLNAEMLEVISVAERARDESASDTSPPDVLVRDEDRAEAEEWLRDPDLFAKLGDDLSQLGVVGEETNLLACYLAVTSRLCERPLGVLVQSSSAGGKSTVVEAISALTPPEDLVSLSALTSQALYYLGGRGLTHKVLVLAEEHGASRASYALKLLLSEGRLAIASTGKDRAGHLHTKNYETTGPLSLLMTTTATDLDPELENRVVVLGVNEDPAQTMAVLEAQRRALTRDGVKARERRGATQRRHVTIQRLLKPYPVLLPDDLASSLAEFPARATRHRRDHAKLLSLVSAIALLHQFQRERTTLTVDDVPVTFIEAAPIDVEHGAALARQLLVRSDNLAPPTRRLFEAFRELSRARTRAVLPGEADVRQVGITRRELREHLGWSDTQVRHATDQLVALEYLVTSPGGRGTCRRYYEVGDFAWVRHDEGRTFGATSSGETDKFVTFVSSDESNKRGEEHNAPYGEGGGDGCGSRTHDARNEDAGAR